MAQQVTLGFEPYPLVVPLPTDGDYSVTLRTSDGSNWPSGSHITLKLQKAFETPTSWSATISGTDATFSVAAATVQALVPGTKYKAELVYTNNSGQKVQWFGTLSSNGTVRGEVVWK